MNQYIQETSEPPKPNDGILDLKGFYGIISSVEEGKISLKINLRFFQPMFEDALVDNCGQLSRKKKRAFLKDLLDCLRGYEEPLGDTYTLEP